jgi:2-polyprenyl-3-methyl-5-hydroxy-6-metoxy-1,4-benzoquinol methylase
MTQRQAAGKKAALDQQQVEKMAFRAIGDMSGAFTMALAYIGDRLGIFRTLAEAGPLTSEELARQTSLQERYIREWLKAMVTSEYVNYDPAARKFFMTDEQAFVLVNEDSPFFVGGGIQMTTPTTLQVHKLMEAFKNGGGVSYAELGPDVLEGTERFFRPGYVNFLTSDWLPAVPGLADRLKAGISVADVGCGAGQALIQMAKAYPNSRFTGIDNDAASIEKAKQNAAAEGVAQKVNFLQLSADQVPAEPKYDLICAFDCIHDMVNPRGALKAIRGALKDDGVYLWTEPNASDRLEENINPIGRIFSTISTLHCMTVSLAHGGEGLGTVIGENGARALAEEAGFSHFEKLPINNPFNQFFALAK